MDQAQQPQPEEPQRLKQLSFLEIESALETHGLRLEQSPPGFNALTRRQANFVTRMLEHGNATRAAIEAGYGKAGAAVAGSETLRNPKVARFYAWALSKVANDAGEIVKRTYQRSVMLHAHFLEAAQEVADLDEMVRVSVTTGEKGRAEYETRRERRARDMQRFSAQANATDALLGQLLGKLNLAGTGGEAANHAVLTPELQRSLIEHRRRLQQNPQASLDFHERPGQQ